MRWKTNLFSSGFFRRGATSNSLKIRCWLPVMVLPWVWQGGKDDRSANWCGAPATIWYSYLLPHTTRILVHPVIQILTGSSRNVFLGSASDPLSTSSSRFAPNGVTSSTYGISFPVERSVLASSRSSRFVLCVSVHSVRLWWKGTIEGGVGLSFARRRPMVGRMPESISFSSSSRGPSTTGRSAPHPPPTSDRTMLDGFAAAYRSYIAMAILFNFLGDQASGVQAMMEMPLSSVELHGG